MANSVVLGTSLQDVSAGYIGFYPCFQANTDTALTDRSGLGNAGTLGTLTTGEAWANANVLTTLAAVNKHGTIPGIATKWLSRNSVLGSFVFAGRVYLTLPGSTLQLFGTTASTRGFKMQVSAAGATSFNWYGDGNVFGATGATALSSATTYSFLLYVNGRSRTSNFYINGVKQIATDTNISSAGDVSASATDLILGASVIGDAGIAARWSGLHVLASAPETAEYASFDELALRLHRVPFTPLSSAEWPA